VVLPLSNWKPKLCKGFKGFAITIVRQECRESFKETFKETVMGYGFERRERRSESKTLWTGVKPLAYKGFSNFTFNFFRA
jgi:hypothetical protein